MNKETINHIPLYKHVFGGKDNNKKVKAIRFSLNKDNTKDFIVGIDINNEFLFEREDITEIMSFLEKKIRSKLTSKAIGASK